MKRILITGSRNWGDMVTIREALDEHGPGVIVHGNCPTGADEIADIIAELWGWETEKHPADWDKHGKAAGPIRNQEMVDLGADICLAFVRPESRGTIDCIKRAKTAGIKVIQYREGQYD